MWVFEAYAPALGDDISVKSGFFSQKQPQKPLRRGCRPRVFAENNHSSDYIYTKPSVRYYFEITR